MIFRFHRSAQFWIASDSDSDPNLVSCWVIRKLLQFHSGGKIKKSIKKRGENIKNILNKYNKKKRKLLYVLIRRMELGLLLLDDDILSSIRFEWYWNWNRNRNRNRLMARPQSFSNKKKLFSFFLFHLLLLGF